MCSIAGIADSLSRLYPGRNGATCVAGWFLGIPSFGRLACRLRGDVTPPRGDEPRVYARCGENFPWTTTLLDREKNRQHGRWDGEGWNSETSRNPLARGKKKQHDGEIARGLQGTHGCWKRVTNAKEENSSRKMKHLNGWGRRDRDDEKNGDQLKVYFMAKNFSSS